jgi:voltage-gated potassium channel
MSDSGWLGTLDRWRCLHLLLAIVVLLAAYPYLMSQPQLVYLYDALVTAVMLFGLYAVSRTRVQFIGIGLFLLVVVVGRWSDLARDSAGSAIAFGALAGAFYFSMAVLVLRYVFSGRTNVGDRLCGALSVYFLMGLGFAEIYGVMYSAEPAAFVFSNPIEPTEIEADFIYLSFVTQTTLGYGDITPRSMAAESLTILHASSAVLYVAVLVAWLVGSIRPAADQE